MPVTVTRIYESEEKAHEAKAALNQQASPNQIVVVTPKEGESAESKLAATGMSAASAKVYAEAVSRGRSVVSVAPYFGRAAAVTKALDDVGPVDTHVSDVPDTVTSRWLRSGAPTGDRNKSTTRAPVIYDPAAPVSSRFGWPLLSDDPAPASRKFGWRTLLDNPAPLSSWLGWRTLSANQGTRASLSDDPAPLSRRFGWRLLLDDPTPASDRFGWRILKNDPAPASSRFGWRTLSDRQSPRTSLIDDPAPLSRLLGLPVLLRERPKSS
ncbi:MAG: hypothetical protein ACJ8AW_34740 [Rhodopila sp.]